jgi:hypothetical protein
MVVLVDVKTPYIADH